MRVIVNCAMSADGKIASIQRKQYAISSEEDMKRVHLLRSKVDAILVGVGTVLADDPSLLVKEKYAPGAKQPMRVVIDPHLRTPRDACVLNKDAPTLVYSCKQGALDGAEVVVLPGPPIPIQDLLRGLEKRKVGTLLVEGGGETIWHFMDQGFVDEYNVYVGSMVLGGRDAPTPVDGLGRKDTEAICMELFNTERLGSGILLSYRVRR